MTIFAHAGPDKLEQLPPQAAPSTELRALKYQMANTVKEIREKNIKLKIQDLKRLLFRCAAMLISLHTVRRTSKFSIIGVLTFR
jgi:phosphatidylinositol 4-kinase